MKKFLEYLLIVILFVLFFWNPLFYIGLFVYFIRKATFKKTMTNITNSIEISPKTSISGVMLKCANCGNQITINHKFCNVCGSAISGDNIKVEANANATPIEVKNHVFLRPSNFDKIYNLSEKEMLEEFINRELTKANIDKNTKLIPSEALKRKKILNIIFSFLIFIYVSLIFFHFPIVTYVIGLILIALSYLLMKKYQFMEYLKKQIKSRPNEKISNIIMNINQTMVEDDSKKVMLCGLMVAVILPMIIFFKPMIWYEKVDGGYGVRYYIFGLTNFTSATIPEKHKGEDVVLLRGNSFSNMPFLREVYLADTITEIRGQAFVNNRSLITVKLPKKLVYLGGSAFYNCTSLESIEIPDSVTYLGGESFYNAKSLKQIKLSKSLTEIRGSTFENCISLESIEIPDSVVRIGGHAFYGNNSLAAVIIGPKSQLNEIGSSAFRSCNRLYEITLPRNVFINERAFKESPTTIKYYTNAIRCVGTECSVY